MLGSDPALWPAGERREGELIAYDKGYYHSYTEEVLMPDYPTLIPKTSTPTPETLPGGGIQLPALFSPDSATAQRVLEFFTANIRNPHTRKAYATAVRGFAACSTWDACRVLGQPGGHAQRTGSQNHRRACPCCPPAVLTVAMSPGDASPA